MRREPATTVHVVGFMVCMLAVLVLGAVVSDQANPLVGLVFVCWGTWVVCDIYGKPEQPKQ